MITEPGGQRGRGRTEVAVPSNGQSDGQYLRFWRISAGDVGEYTCQAKNIVSAQNSTALRVDVLYGPTGLALSMDSKVRESSLVTIHCSVESFPPSELTLAWDPPSSDRLSDLSRHPKRLQGKSTVQSTRTSLTASFPASVGDVGRYTCRAKNSEGLKETTKELVVHYAPKGVRITASRTLEGIYEGAAVSLTCEVQSSNPSVRSYSWYRDRTALGEAGTVLHFPAVRPEDRGSYRCQASNSAGSGDSPEVTITVNYGPRGTKIKASCCQRGVKAGESLTLTCETDARPEPGYTWFRTITEPGGQRGPGRTEVAVPSNGRSDGRDLRFWQISAGDAGEYMCQAKNIISAEKSPALRVDVLYGPTGLNLSMDSEVRESSLVTIHCSVESFPLSELTLTWAPPSSDRLSDLSRHPKRLQGNYTDQPTRTSLVASFITSVEQAGRYTCRAKNSEGLKETTKDLVVHCKWAESRDANVMLVSVPCAGWPR
ncbi:B-cell receptor CD22-like isoform X3 [Anguilla rostrata]|uniref:B-cell receptor CD22-like isoform X3 n=1 Tax=Anguilla rostrata TaxID=7938 RepID=UPI0030D4B7CC